MNNTKKGSQHKLIEDPDSSLKASTGWFELAAVIQTSPQSPFGGGVVSEGTIPVVVMNQFVLHHR